jgi:hypothetical protein
MKKKIVVVEKQHPYHKKDSGNQKFIFKKLYNLHFNVEITTFLYSSLVPCILSLVTRPLSPNPTAFGRFTNLGWQASPPMLIFVPQWKSPIL